MSGAPRLPVLYGDADYVAVDKPAGLASVPSAGMSGRTCLSELRHSHPEAIAVHRLDRETSGVLLFALHEQARRSMVRAFREGRVEKAYWAFVRGCPDPARGEVDRAIRDHGKVARLDPRGQPALTRYRILKRYADASWVEVRPITGRYNQIRLHFAAIRHPLLGERKYARGRDSRIRVRRLALHARRLSFPLLADGRIVSVKSPMPDDLEELQARLSGS